MFVTRIWRVQIMFFALIGFHLSSGAMFRLVYLNPSLYHNHWINIYQVRSRVDLNTSLIFSIISPSKIYFLELKLKDLTCSLCSSKRLALFKPLFVKLVEMSEQCCHYVRQSIQTEHPFYLQPTKPVCLMVNVYSLS